MPLIRLDNGASRGTLWPLLVSRGIAFGTIGFDCGELPLAEMVAVIIIAAGLVSGSFYLHYTVLRYGARLIIREERYTRRPLLMVLALVFLAHLAEVLLFATGYYIMHWSQWLGSLSDMNASNPDDFARYFYFSISSYTTLGVGDVVPIGPLRIIAGIEALTGLVLIAWTASFSYLMMERFWSEAEGE